ncbi:MAG: hypothetical protein MJ137_05855 [Clostridia bacterium]|nr:hypothetical protein [Clostridia bacterium]
MNSIWKKTAALLSAFCLLAPACLTAGAADGSADDIDKQITLSASANGRELTPELEGMLDGIKDNVALTDVQKALLLHDRLAAYAEFHTDAAPSQNGIFDGKKANAAGYAEAYEKLLTAVGIEAATVSSQALSHVWNTVKIDGKTYYVDVAWDDPVYDGQNGISGLITHSNFLRSSAGMASTGHNASDYGDASASTDYDGFSDAIWQSSVSPFVLLNGKIYYMNNFIGTNSAPASYTDGALMEWTASGPVAVRPRVSWKSSYYSVVYTGDNEYNMYTYNSLTTDGEYLYYSNGKVIYRLNPEASSNPEVFYSLDVSPFDTTVIFGLSYEDGALSFKTGVNASQAAAAEEQYFCYGHHDFVSNICSRCGYSRRLSQFTSISVSHSCTVENDLSLNYYFTLGSNGADYSKFDNVRLEVVKKDFDGDGNVVESRVFLTPRLDTSKGYNRFKFTFKNISASEIGNEISAVLHAEYDGKDYCSGSDNYNIKKYAYTMLGQSTAKASLKTLLVDLLNYSAASQKWFDYNLDNPVNAELTDAQKQLGTQGAVSFDSMNLPEGAVLPEAAASFNSRAVVLGSNIELKYYMILPADVALSRVSLSLTYSSLIDGSKSAVIPGTSFIKEKDRYSAKLSTVRACDLGQPVTAVILIDGVPASSEMVYNAEAYARNMINICDENPGNAVYADLKNLLEEMVKYSRSAKAYFENQ